MTGVDSGAKAAHSNCLPVVDLRRVVSHRKNLSICSRTVSGPAGFQTRAKTGFSHCTKMVPVTSQNDFSRPLVEKGGEGLNRNPLVR